MIIKEFLPNPVGSDKEGEYIKILNDSDVAVNLAGWKISDAANKTFNLSGIIKPKEEKSFSYLQTKISLNNSGESVFLFDSKGVLISKLSYTGAAEEGKVFINQQTLKTKTEFEGGQVVNQHLMPSIVKIFGLDIFLGIVLGLVAVYVILQLEKKLDKKLY